MIKNIFKSSIAVAIFVLAMGASAYLPVISSLFDTAVTVEAATYSVDYSYNSKKYSVSSVSGDSTVDLEDILSAIELTGTVSNVSSFNDTYISVSETEGNWTVTTHEAFGEGELYVTIDNTEYTLKVLSLPDSISVVLYSYIHFNSNGGSGTMTTVDKWNTSHTDSALIREEAYYTLPECDYTAPENYIFDGWEINGLKYLPGDQFYYTHALVGCTVKATWKEKISSTYVKLTDTIGYCVDSTNNKTYIIYGFTPEDGKSATDYEYVAFYDSSNDKIAPADTNSLPEYIDTEGKINTVYSKIQFAENDVLTSETVGKNYIVAIEIDEKTTPSATAFSARAIDDFEQGDDVNDP
ncbi:MAG: hypothetical protein IJS61_08670 [Firmicutes bacterium]|nr:hypothetical protein [Bacillota bacterium]